MQKKGEVVSEIAFANLFSLNMLAFHSLGSKGEGDWGSENNLSWL